MKVPLQEFDDVIVENLPEFVTIFHPSRSRSTLLLKDFFLSDQYFCLNEPFPYTKKDDYFIKIYAQLIKNFRSQKLCLKSNMQLNFNMLQFIDAFPSSCNLFIYRNPYDVYLSNLEEKYFRKDFFNEDSERLQELLRFGHGIVNIYKDVLNLLNEKKIRLISYNDLNNPDFSYSLIESISGSLDESIREKIKESRKFHAHYGKEAYKLKVIDQSKYKFELAYFKSKTGVDKVIKEFSKIIETN